MKGLEFIIVHLCDLLVFPWLFWWILEPFLGKFVVSFWRCFFARFLVGITNEELVPLFLVILPLQTRGKAFNFSGFRGSSSS
jgi:hypothetical protein